MIPLINEALVKNLLRPGEMKDKSKGSDGSFRHHMFEMDLLSQRVILYIKSPKQDSVFIAMRLTTVIEDSLFRHTYSESDTIFDIICLGFRARRLVHNLVQLLFSTFNSPRIIGGYFNCLLKS